VTGVPSILTAAPTTINALFAAHGSTRSHPRAQISSAAKLALKNARSMAPSPEHSTSNQLSAQHQRDRLRAVFCCVHRVAFGRPLGLNVGPGGFKMMRITIAATLSLVSSLAFAQNCNISGNATFCDDGLTGIRSGNTTFWSDGSSSIHSGVTTFNSDGSSSIRSGNTTFHSDGTSSIRSGNTTFFSDGRSCIRSGNSIFCN
jgi:uncharacterized Zn-binding protein involved in type VI secretion